MILTDLQSSIGAIYNEKDFQPLMPALVVLDEFGSYAIPDFSVVFEQAREAGIAVVAAFQLTSQLSDIEKGLSKGFLETVMGNTETKVFTCGSKAWSRHCGPPTFSDRRSGGSHRFPKANRLRIPSRWSA